MVQSLKYSFLRIVRGQSENHERTSALRKIPAEEAVGQTLCHDITAIDASGAKGVRFKRNHVITAEDIPALLDIGKSHLYVWEPDADEVHEEDAARAVVEAACDETVTLRGPSEGKFTVSAAHDGLFVLNKAALRAINMVDDYTFASRYNLTRVKAGEDLAGCRIVPLTTKKANVEAAAKAAAEGYPVFHVAPFIGLKTALIVTGSEVYTGRIEDKFEPIIAEKLKAFGAELMSVTKCPDDDAFIEKAARAALEDGAEAVIFTGGMSVDPDDVTPTVIRRMSDSFITQGVAMQPGNMLTIGYAGSAVLMGLPAASMKAPVTSADVFMGMAYAGIPITREDVANLGEGGLCISCKECTWPVCYFGAIRG